MNSRLIEEATGQMATLPYNMQEKVLKFIIELKQSQKKRGYREKFVKIFRLYTIR